jgi:hypothetical protein
MKVVPALLLVWLGTACGPDAKAYFPKDYLSTYTEVRDCRNSSDHDLRFIRVLANPIAYDTYINRDGPFPTGSILLKEERDESTTCMGPITSITAAKKLPDGSSPETLDWEWQRVDPETLLDVTEDESRCYNCHSGCPSDSNPGGYLYTCAAAP